MYPASHTSSLETLPLDSTLLQSWAPAQAQFIWKLHLTSLPHTGPSLAFTCEPTVRARWGWEVLTMHCQC